MRALRPSRLRLHATSECQQFGWVGVLRTTVYRGTMVLSRQARLGCAGLPGHIREGMIHGTAQPVDSEKGHATMDLRQVRKAARLPALSCGGAPRMALPDRGAVIEEGGQDPVETRDALDDVRRMLDGKDSAENAEKTFQEEFVRGKKSVE